MILPRPDFIQTMTDSERNIMKAHGDYLQSLTEVGSIVCHGRVDDPKGGWVNCSHNDSANTYFRVPSMVAHAWATAELALSVPGEVAQPPFSTKLPCM